VTEEPEEAPGVGAAVHDTARDRYGRIAGHEGPHLQVRPFSGGRTWTADPDHLRPLSQDELLKILVAEANARSRRSR
jgi:hypothetical protein